MYVHSVIYEKIATYMHNDIKEKLFFSMLKQNNNYFNKCILSIMAFHITYQAVLTGRIVVSPSCFLREDMCATLIIVAAYFIKNVNETHIFEQNLQSVNVSIYLTNIH